MILKSPATSNIILSIARIGYIARSFLFLSIGTMSFMTACGLGGREAGFHEVVHALMLQPPGQVIALFMAIGLMCFAAWRFAEAFLPFDNRTESLLQRAAFAGSGLLYSGMGIWTVGLILQARSAVGGSDQAARQWTEWVFEYSYGFVAVMGAGVAFVAAAVVVVIRAIKPDFKSSVALRPQAPAFLGALGRYGLVCRAIVLAEVGGFLIYATLISNSREALIAVSIHVTSLPIPKRLGLKKADCSMLALRTQQMRSSR